MPEKIIEIENVCKEYQLGKAQVKALCDITLDIFKGDFVIILGPSGSGKSTLMHIMGALDKPSRGKIKIKGKDITVLDEWVLAMLRRKTTGFIFQSFNLVPTLTALENVILPLEPIKMDEVQKIKQGKALLKLVSLEHRMHHKPSELSGGEMQRVAIARSLINNPAIILADEPTGNLDSKTGLKIIEAMRKLNREEKKTFIIVTHDSSLVQYGNRIIRLKDGAIEKIEER